MSDFLNCQECVELLVEYLEGELDPALQKQLDEHFSACPPCVNYVDSYRKSMKMVSHFREIAPSDVPPELEERLRSFLKDRL